MNDNRETVAAYESYAEAYAAETKPDGAPDPPGQGDAGQGKIERGEIGERNEHVGPSEGSGTD